MIIKTAIVIRRLSRASFVIGMLCLILGFVLSFVNLPASASNDQMGILDQVLDYQPNLCTFGFKCEPPGCEPDPYSSWSAPAGNQICKIVIKAGSHAPMEFYSDGCADISPPDGDGNPDYCAYGLGTDFGEAERLCEEDGQAQCYAISHSDYYIDVLPPSPTLTDTGVPPSPTLTDTGVPPSQTPTNTSTSLPTSTLTTTSTPTGTPLAATNTPTVTDTQPTATMTDTPIPLTETPTPTATKAATPTTVSTSTSTMTQVTTATDLPTNTVVATSSPTSTSTFGPTATQTQPPTLPPPPQITTTPVLIPVTGADLSGVSGQVSMLAGLLINFGIGMVGLALVFLGLGKRLGSQ